MLRIEKNMIGTRNKIFVISKKIMIHACLCYDEEIFFFNAKERAKKKKKKKKTHSEKQNKKNNSLSLTKKFTQLNERSGFSLGLN